jgi:hypothetical protein
MFCPPRSSNYPLIREAHRAAVRDSPENTPVANGLYIAGHRTPGGARQSAPHTHAQAAAQRSAFCPAPIQPRAAAARCRPATAAGHQVSGPPPPPPSPLNPPRVGSSRILTSSPARHLAAGRRHTDRERERD